MLNKAAKALTISKMLAGVVAGSGGRHHLVKSMRAYSKQSPAECNFCGFKGKFLTHGYTARMGVACPKCNSVDRHRLLMMAAQSGFFDLAGKRILHFAPEKSVTQLVKGFGPTEYKTADIQPGRADMMLNMEAIDLPAESVDLVIASHVLEHVDDKKALAQIRRVLTPGGQLIAMVPLVEGWVSTYEDPSKVTDQERAEHFGQPDHVRFYGADFRDRIRNAGFKLDEFTAGGADSVRYRLSRGEKVFLATKAP